MTLRKHLHSDSVPFKGNVQALKLKAKFEISVGIIFFWKHCIWMTSWSWIQLSISIARLATDLCSSNCNYTFKLARAGLLCATRLDCCLNIICFCVSLSQFGFAGKTITYFYSDTLIFFYFGFHLGCLFECPIDSVSGNQFQSLYTWESAISASAFSFKTLRRKQSSSLEKFRRGSWDLAILNAIWSGETSTF